MRVREDYRTLTGTEKTAIFLLAVLPIGAFAPLAGIGVLAGGVMATTVGVGLVESLLARFAFKQVPFLLTLAFLLCLFALLVAWKGGAA